MATKSFESGFIVSDILLLMAALIFFGVTSRMPQKEPMSEEVVYSDISYLFESSELPNISEPRSISSSDHILGSSESKNTFIVYTDFQCPACALFEAHLEEIRSSINDSKLIYRHFPLFKIHKNSIEAAVAAEAAARQGKFWEMSRQLFENQEAWSKENDPIETFMLLAKKADVKYLDDFKHNVLSAKDLDRVKQDFLEASALNLQGTPTVFFNGHQLPISDFATLKREAQKYAK